MTAAVVTGIGIMAGDGTGVDAHWKDMLDGRSWIQPLQRYDASRYSARLAGQVAGFGVPPACLADMSMT